MQLQTPNLSFVCDSVCVLVSGSRVKELEAFATMFPGCSGSAGARELLQGIDVGGITAQFLKDF
jgi:hypothetical protein